MFASILPRMTGLGALWRVDPMNVLLGADASAPTEQLARPSTSKVHAAAALQTDAFAKKKPRKPRSINDRLRSLIGDMISEDELQQRLTFGRLLGSGATSKVYAAVDTRTGEEVAVKVFDKAAMIDVRRSMVADGDFVREKAVHRVRRRLLKVVSELEISRSLAHPNIIKYIGAYETSHRICIVHELVDGCDLLEHLLAHGKMSEARAAHVFRQLLAALQYCHDRNIYHRDLKLENVLITPTDDIKLIDFGLSEVAAPGATLDTICGTPLYCSPEVLFLHSTPRRRGFFGGPADVWSVGVLIFALLTGCAPFDDSNFATLRDEIYHNAIAYPTHVTDEVKGLLKALLVFDPQLRPTVKDILAYGWFKLEDANAAQPTPLVLVTTENNTLSSLAEPCKRASLASKSPQKDANAHVLSSMSASATDSTSGSFDDTAAKVTPAAAAAASCPTHLACLEAA